MIDVVKFLIEVDRETWEKFKKNLDQSKPIYEHIQEMIKERAES